MNGEIVGYEESIVGDEDVDALLDMVGAAPRRQQAAGRPRQVLASELPKGFVGIPITSIATGTTGTPVQVPIIETIRPDRLVLSDAASALDIYDIKIGTVSLNVSVNPIPGVAFSKDAVGTQLRCAVTANPNSGMSISVGQSSGAAIVLKGGFIGPVRLPY